MSLHIGRLSRDVEQRYLENIFRKFGPCTIKLKNGYGFAVYDANDDATRAMRALHGKYICGERITVHWSKQQPRSFHSFRRSSRFIESSHRRTSRDVVDNFMLRDSIAQKNRLVSHGQNPNPDPAPEKKHDEITEVLKDSGGNSGEHPEEMKRDEGATIDASAIEHDRWFETGKDNLDGDGDDFDHYEPYHGFGRQDKKKKDVKANSYDPHDCRHSSEKWQKHPTECFDLKHTAYDCPQESNGKFKTWMNELNLRGKPDLRLRRSISPSRRQPEFHADTMIQTHNGVKDEREQFSDRIGRVRRLSNVSSDNKRRTRHNESMPEAPKETRKRSRSNQSRLVSLSSDGISSYSRSRSSYSHSHSRNFPSRSAHSSSNSSQPTQHEGIRLNSDAPMTSFKLDTLSNGESLIPGNDDKVTGYTEANLDNNLVNGDIVAYGRQGQKANLEDISSVKSNHENLVKKRSSNSLNLTTPEVVLALKSYGMEAREVDSLNRPVESYFGAARLWPWEIIYYRRCKKGPISTENYSKRLEQNKEYGIRDQYVRSSSGWWECH